MADGRNTPPRPLANGLDQIAGSPDLAINPCAGFYGARPKIGSSFMLKQDDCGLFHRRQVSPRQLKAESPEIDNRARRCGRSATNARLVRRIGSTRPPEAGSVGSPCKRAATRSNDGRVVTIRIRIDIDRI